MEKSGIKVMEKSGFGVFLIHPSMASVLLSASVERCFVSRMRDFYRYISKNHYILIPENITALAKMTALLTLLQ